MGNQARVFCLRVSGVQTSDLSDQLLEALKHWSEFDERDNNGEITFCSRRTLGVDGPHLLNLLHTDGVRFNYFARMQDDEVFKTIEAAEAPLAETLPLDVSNLGRPTHFTLAFPVDELERIPQGTIDLIHDTAIEEYTDSFGMRRYVIPPFERFVTATIQDRLIQGDHAFVFSYVPKAGGA